MKTIVTALFIGLLLGQLPAAQPPSVVESLQRFEELLSRVPRTESNSAAHRRASDALAALQQLSTRWPAQSPEDYRTNLAQDVRALAAVIDKSDPARVRETLLAVAEDLETKLEHCRKSGGRLGGSVVVRVRTLKGADESKSWQVVYIPKILEVSETATPDVFPQLSSPTEEPLVPGRYVMWARLPGTSRTGERTIIKVGEGRKELLVDLPVPPDIRR